MNKEDTLTISAGEKNYLISIEPCNKERDGQFIRELTKENCYDYLNNTIGWDEERNLQEPKFPERYLMLFHNNSCIGFIMLSERNNCLYINTLQLIQRYRRQGIGTNLLQFIEDIARKKAKDKVQLRVINGNPAISLYRRNGFRVIEEQEWCCLMEKALAAS